MQRKVFKITTRSMREKETNLIPTGRFLTSKRADILDCVKQIWVKLSLESNRKFLWKFLFLGRRSH